MDPFLTYSDRRDLRKVWCTDCSRGDNNDAKDNNAVIGDPQAARPTCQRRGFRPMPIGGVHADGQDPRKRHGPMMAALPCTLPAFMKKWPKCRPLLQRKGRDQDRALGRRHYAKKVRTAIDDLDMSQVKEDLQLDKLREGMRIGGGQLYAASPST